MTTPSNPVRIVGVGEGASDPVRVVDISPGLLSAGGVVTYLVAASNASTASKSRADWVCDGTADEVQINAAIAALPASGGRVILSEGTFTVAAPVISDVNSVTIEGMGWRATTIQVATGVDPTAIIICGNTQNVQENVIRNLRVYGRTDVEVHAAGDGIIFRSNNGLIEHVQILRMAHDSVVVNAYSGQIWEVYLHNVISELPQNDGFVFGANCYDYECVRCIAYGGSQEAPAFGQRGFMVGGRIGKFIGCHAYFCQNAGLRTDTDGTERIQVIGGDYETCYYGVWFNEQSSGQIIGVKCSANTGGSDIIAHTSSGVLVMGCECRSTQAQNIYFYNSDNCLAIGNVCENATTASIKVDTGSQNCLIQGNVVDSAISTDDISNRIRDNIGWITENSGTGSIASGTTADVIAHGLSVTPTVDDISITLAENPTNTPGAIWVDTIGAANFTVNCENDPGASNLDFGWRVAVL